jgi:hypothetical protein
MQKFLMAGGLAGLLVLGTARAGDEPRFAASFQTSYNGTHPDLYAQQQDRVRILIKQAQLEISSQLGLLQYQEGFRCPLTVRFDDTPAPGVEHALAYVQIIPSVRGVAQELTVNLDVMDKYPGQDFDQIFYHEMTHAVLNDAVAFPTRHHVASWIQEGLAVYIAGNGNELVKQFCQQFHRSQAASAVRDLDQPVLDYPRDYLAFRYIVDQHTINSFQAFVRLLTNGKTPAEAVEESTGLTWDAFREKVKDYTTNVYKEQALPDY